MKVSNCCGAPMDAIMEDVEICPQCHEHCECECSHEWEVIDPSFDHEFGTEKITPYEKCLHCDETREHEPFVPEPDYDLD